MKKIIHASFILLSFAINAQQKNTLLEQNYWKSNPDITAVKAEISKGNNPAELNPSAYDPTVLSINNGAPDATIKFLIEQPGNSIEKLTHDGRTYLHWAANKGNINLVEYLVSKGADIHLEDSHGATPLTYAASNGLSNPAIYEIFFAKGIDPKKKYKDGVNLLLMVIPHDKDLSVVNYLSTKGLSLKDVDAEGNTAFNYATKLGNVGLLKNILNKGGKFNDNALLMAAQGTRRTANTIGVFQYLVDDLKIKPTVLTNNGETVLHFITKKQNQSDIIKYFLEKEVDANKTDLLGNTAFINAASMKDLAVLELLLPKVKNINAQNLKGESALAQAVKSGSAETVAFLLNNNADVTCIDKSKNTLVTYLIQSYKGTQSDDFDAKIKLLQEKGLNFSAPQNDGNTIYHLAVAKNDLDLLQKIAPLKVDVNAKNNEGMTALHKAAMVAKNNVVLKYLLSIGAKKEISTEFDETAYDLAKENEFLIKNNVAIDFLK